jgi:magnesium-transporting ATPase (P-type)
VIDMAAEYKQSAWQPLTEMRRTEILSANDALAGRALRTPGIASRASSNTLTANDVDDDDHIERDLVFAGLVGMINPPQGEAAQARSSCCRCWRHSCCGSTSSPMAHRPSRRVSIRRIPH